MFAPSNTNWSYTKTYALLITCIENKMLMLDKADEDNMFIYRENVGWQSEPIQNLAYELISDKEGRDYLMSQLLEQSGISFETIWNNTAKAQSVSEFYLDGVFLIRDQSLSCEDLTWLTNTTCHCFNQKVVPFEHTDFQNRKSVMGFVRENLLQDMAFDSSELIQLLESIVTDPNGRHTDGKYTFEKNGKTFSILVSEKLISLP